MVKGFRGSQKGEKGPRISKHRGKRAKTSQDGKISKKCGRSVVKPWQLLQTPNNAAKAPKTWRNAETPEKAPKRGQSWKSTLIAWKKHQTSEEMLKKRQKHGRRLQKHQTSAVMRQKHQTPPKVQKCTKILKTTPKSKSVKKKRYNNVPKSSTTCKTFQNRQKWQNVGKSPFHQHVETMKKNERVRSV